jgi:cell division protein FtsL
MYKESLDWKVATKHKASSLVIQALRLLRSIAIPVVLLELPHERRSLVVERRSEELEVEKRRHEWKALS